MLQLGTDAADQFGVHGLTSRLQPKQALGWGSEKFNFRVCGAEHVGGWVLVQGRGPRDDFRVLVFLKMSSCLE